MLQLFPKAFPITHSLSVRCSQLRRLLPTLRDFPPCFEKMKVEKKNIFFSTSGLPRPFPHPLPFSLQLLPHFSPRFSCPFFGIRPRSPFPSRLPLSPLVLPFPPGGVAPEFPWGWRRWLQEKHKDDGGVEEGEVGGRGGGSGDVAQRAVWARGYRAPTTATPLFVLIHTSGLVLLSFWRNTNGPCRKRKEKVVKSNQKDVVVVPDLLLHAYIGGWGGWEMWFGSRKASKEH